MRHWDCPCTALASLLQLLAEAFCCHGSAVSRYNAEVTSPQPHQQTWSAIMPGSADDNVHRLLMLLAASSTRMRLNMQGTA